MSRTYHRWAFVFVLILAVVASACQPTATPTPTPRPTATEIPPTEVVTEEATEVAPEVATEEPTEVITEEATEVATEEATMEQQEATEVVTEEPTEMATEELTEVATEVVTEEATLVPTKEPTKEPTEVPTEEATVAPTEVPTEEATSEPVEVAGVTITVAAGENVVIGLALGLSGEGIATLGIDIQRGAELALEDRPTVTIDGEEFSVMLDIQDEQCSAEGAQTVANRFASDTDIMGVVGPMCSSSCRAAAPIFDAAGYTTISPSCTAPDLTTSGYSSFNRAVVSDAFQGAIAAQYIYDVLGVRTIATIHDGSPYGEGLVTVVGETFEALGGEVVSSDAVAVGDTDFRGLLDDIAQAEPELIYFAGFPAEAARLIQQRADAGLEDVTFMSADGIAGTEVIDLAGEATEGVYATKAIPASSQALTDFLDRYLEVYGEEPPAPYHANGYDAVNILLDAVEAVGTVDADGNLVVNREDVAAYVRSLSDFQGLIGVLNATGTGETSVADIGIFVVQDGEFVQTYTGNMVEGEVELTEYEAPVVEEPTEEATEAPTEAAEEPTEEATAEATASS